jgi:cobalt/nickel transport system permease protein
MHLPEIDKYAHLSSPFHKLDPMIKIPSFGILILCIALTRDIKVALLGFLFSCLLVFLSRIPLSFIFIHLRWVLIFVLFFFLILPLTYHLIDGLRLASLIGLRALSCVLLLFPMIGTSRFDQTLKALQNFRLPNRLVQLIMFSYRYIFVFFDEFLRMFNAVITRGADRQVNIQHLKIISYIIGMLFVRAYERTNKVYYAMVSRGYTGRLVTIEEFKVKLMDVGMGVLIIACAILLRIVDWIL